MTAPARRIAASAPTISIRNYITVTAAYWAFTLTDGALRMLVLTAGDRFTRWRLVPAETPPYGLCQKEARS